MRVGLFTDTYLPDINGVVSSIETLRWALTDLGHEVFVVCTKPSLKKAELEGHVLRLPGIEAKKIYGYSLTGPMHLRAKKIIREMKLDVIHAHTEFGAGIFARLISHDLSIPLVATYHTFYEDYTHYINVFNISAAEVPLKMVTRKFSKFFGNYCQQLIVPTLKTKERLLDYGVKTKMTIIPTGLDFSNFESREVIDSPFSQKQYTVIYVGRIAEEKSVDVIVNAVKLLHDQGELIHLIIVGDGPGKSDIDSLVKKYQAESYIYMAGKILHSDVVKYYNYADCFVSASMSETQGMTFIEAMSTGKPILAADRVALNNVLIDGETGYYFQDYKDLAAKILVLKNMDEQKAKDMKLSTKQIVEEYSPKTFGKKVAAVYSDAIENYNQVANITKLKLGEKEVKITVTQKEEDMVYTISYDSYLDNRYHKGDGLDEEQLQKLLSLHRYWYAFKKAAQKVEASDKTEKEIRDLLKSLKVVSQQQIDEMIDYFKNLGYLSDKGAAESQAYIDQNRLLGKRRTAQKLQQRGVSKQIIDEMLEVVDSKEEKERGILKANAYLKSIHDKSYKETIRYLKEKLVMDGYENVDDIINELDISFNQEAEREALVKLYEKTKRSYGRKYSGKELYQRQYKYLLSKGFSSGMIQEVLNINDKEQYYED